MNKLLIAVFALASLGTASAQIKLGVINTQKALLETDEIKKAQAEMEAKFKPRSDKMLKLQKDLEDIQAQLSSGKLNELGTQELTAEGQRNQRDLQEDVERERNEIIQRAGTRMQEVVKKVADEKGLDLVVDSTSTAFFKTTFEITADATAAR